MTLHIQFLGAAENVTGSRYLLETGETRILIDCGLYQERDFVERNWSPFPVPPGSIDAVLLTHAHIDHCGYLPRLKRDGFKGNIYCTPVSGEIARIIMLDSARIQTEDAANKRRRHERENRKSARPIEPLYTVEDVEALLPMIVPVNYDVQTVVGQGIRAVFHDAGHILGSSSISVIARQGNRDVTVLFSGDVGRWERPFLNDPAAVPKADYVIVESTYGDRDHEDQSGVEDHLARVVNETGRRGGNVVIPSFAVERTQELLYHFERLLRANKIPHLFTFLDSPMAINVTEIFKRHPEIQDAESRASIAAGHSPFNLPGLMPVRTADESKNINHIKGSAIIIAGSGMCTGGRIKHHLVNNISSAASTILFVGYQAIGTLGRVILDGVTPVRILGNQYAVRAKIEQITGFSGHADRQELLRWLSGLKAPPHRVFVTHGEPEAAAAFAKLIRQEKGWTVAVPKYAERFELDVSPGTPPA